MKEKGTPANLLDREPPYPYLIKAIDLYKVRGLDKEGCILEIGCNRSPLRYSLFEESEERDLDLDGHSTLYFASTGDRFFSIDIEPNHIAIAKADVERLFPDHGYFHAIIGDGIEILKMASMFGETISLLYLDAFDLNLPDSAENHLKTLITAMPLMSTKSLILIDDCDVDYVNEQWVWSDGISGKGAKAIPYALDQGYEIIFKGRQTLLERI